MSIEPPECLLEARRALEHLPFCTIVDDYAIYENCRVLHIRVRIQSGGEIPQSTDWYVAVPEDYPYGEIDIYPAKDGGIIKTYRHQSYNSEGKSSLPWRTGKPCVSTGFRFWGRKQYDVEPREISARLAWHVERLWAWLEAADSGRLVCEGDPFEIPDYPGQSVFKSFGYFHGDAETLKKIDTVKRKSGSAIVGKFKQTNVWFLKCVKNEQEASLIEDSDAVPDAEQDEFAIWAQMDEVPHLDPWQGVRTYGELRQIMAKSHVDLDGVILRCSQNLRDGKRHLLILGFPVPKVIGDSECIQQWLACRLPVLTTKKVKGFRRTPHSFGILDRRTCLSDGAEIEWLSSRCWDESEILSRGALPIDVRRKKFVIIGAGAFGSMVAEMLARNGVKDFTLIDQDLFDVGNLVRHTLGLNSVGLFKVDELAKRLKQIQPGVRVVPIVHRFERMRPSNEMIEAADVVVDCTGEDCVLKYMGDGTTIFAEAKDLISVSIGMAAKRLFVYSSRGTTFPFKDFQYKLRPIIDAEKVEWDGKQVPWEGVGCWNPVFPARSDDMWMLASVAVKEIEAFVGGGREGLTVYEQKCEGDKFVGVIRKDEQ